jgi:cobalamin biosynthesis protein CbiD
MVMTEEDVAKVRMLERTKQLIVSKIERLNEVDNMQSQIEEMSAYLGTIEESINSVMAAYSEQIRQRSVNDSHAPESRSKPVLNAFLSEFNPMCTPLRIDRGFFSFQNTQREHLK